MSAHDTNDPGAVAAALALASTSLLVLLGGAALVAGLEWWRALLLGGLLAMSLSGAAALAVVVLTVRPRRAAAPRSPGVEQDRRSSHPAAAPPASAAEQAARDAVRDRESELVRSVARQSSSPELMQSALRLHEARLALARLLLAEHGDLPQELKDELVVSHRGLAAWLETGARPPEVAL